MRASVLLLAEHAVSRLRGTAGWEEIAAGAGLTLPLDPNGEVPGALLVAVADRLAAALSTDRATALRAIGEHGFPLLVDNATTVFDGGEDDLTPAQQADQIFGRIPEVVAALTGPDGAHAGPQMLWTREGRRREFTVRAGVDVCDLIQGSLIALMDWLDLDARIDRIDVAPGIHRFELWYD